MQDAEKKEMLSKLIEALLSKPSHVEETIQKAKPKRKYEFKDKTKAEEKREFNKISLALSRMRRTLTTATKLSEEEDELKSKLTSMTPDQLVKIQKYQEDIDEKKSMLALRFAKPIKSEVVQERTEESEHFLDEAVPAAIESKPEEVINSPIVETPCPPTKTQKPPQMEVDEPQSYHLYEPKKVNKYLEMSARMDEESRQLKRRREQEELNAMQEEDNTAPSIDSYKRSDASWNKAPGNMSGMPPLMTPRNVKGEVIPIVSKSSVRDKLRKAMFPDYF